ncbi:doublecortin domain-containing protein 2C [Struthio camelus]|uniref:doublecortin domain-containing protein 2C n=1 Tax=Struthio camelus TaxID=8801 RepID=UPI003603E2AF
MVASPAPPPGCSRADLVPARTVLVYLNGDPFFPGKKFVINRRHVPTFEALLAQLSEAVAAPYGVRALYTPRQGHRVRQLGDIEQGGRYVAAGLEKFKKLDYIEIGIKKQQGKRKEVMIKPVVHSTIRVPSRWQCIYNKPRHINVFTNGEMIKPPIKFIIPRFTLKNWNCVLALINEKMLLRSGGVHRLYTLDGRAVHSSDGLEDNHFYVAVGRENFKPLPYWRSPRVPSEVRCLYGESRASSRRSKKKKARSEKPRVRKSSSIPPGKPVKNLGVEDEKVNSDFHGKSKKASPKRTSDPALAKASSIFTADKPREEVQGAEEVQDDKNVQVEMPIDQIPAEIVQEEEIAAPTSNTMSEVEEDALTSEDTPKKEEKKIWDMKNLIDLIRRKPDNSKDSTENEGQTEKPEEEPEEEDNS